MQGAGLVTGAMFAGFRIEKVLGRGGMGTVYLAGHPRLPRLIALKLLSRELYADEELRRRFEREADVAAALDHPNIVSVLDRGAEDGQLWISMQYVDGSDAGEFDEPVDPVRAVRIIAQTADALDFAHERGVLHRDVKPANILLTAGRGGDRVLLTDFGIARLLDDQHHLTQTGQFLATLSYAAPEQLSGEPVDHRVDQYALGCTLYTLLTGQPPFVAANPGEMVAAHLTRPVPRASHAVPGIPPAIDAVIARAMAKLPGERYSSCSEFAEAAAHALTVGSQAGQQYAPPPPVPAPPAPAPGYHALEPTVIAPARRQVSANWRLTSVLLMVMALVAVAGIGAVGVYWKFIRPVPIPPSWGDHADITFAFPELIPRYPNGTAWHGARCSAVGTIVATAGDPPPVRQITCTDSDNITTWYTQYATPADLQTYLEAHTVRIGQRATTAPADMVLHQPKDPAAPFALATYRLVTPDARTLLIEVSWPGHTFEQTRDQWWEPAPI
ncbi:serine/threonine-protein kinase [Nocardia sp. NPDC056000]|uniref:serine/threonine-protein kinase n=1 Tax=Nocardia sp. NPDC056000 TaxID=3345674 RepID=UPI0035D91235